MRLLIVEDDVRLADTLAELLKENDYDVETVNDGQSGLDYAVSGYYDFIILDVMLPKMNGFEVVKHLRKQNVHIPVLLLTARDNTDDKIIGLDAGADDYLTKPFVPGELLARIRALSRRQGEVVMDKLTYEDLTLNLSQHLLECGSKSIRLASKEFEMMQLLLKNRPIIVTKEDFIVKVWGLDSDAEDNNVEVYISFLRKKLTFLNSVVCIRTARKAGYFLEKRDANV